MLTLSLILYSNIALLNSHLKINYLVAMFTISYFGATKVQHQFPLPGAGPLNYLLHKASLPTDLGHTIDDLLTIL